MSQAEFSVSFRGMSSERLRDALTARVASDPSARGALTLEVRPAASGTRDVDPTVLVAITGVLGTVLGTIITGLFQLAQNRKSGTVIVLTASGARLEAPVDAKPEELEVFIRKARELDVAHIHVGGND
jgi:hypothetical protein